MALVVRCPNPACGRQLRVADDMAGKTIRCDACQKAFQVPVPAKPAGADAGTVLLARPSPPSVQSAIRPRSEISPPADNPQSAIQQDPLIGTKIAHYRIQAVLGEGGMGKVYKAHNTSLDKTCAIKILPQDFAKQDQANIDRFVREARSAAKVEHTNVLPVQFVGKVAEHYFIEMQYVDGGTLQGVLKQKGKLEVKEAAQIIRDVAAGLQAAHEKGIIHRDIKPTNVMLTSKGHVYVMDFGLAKSAHARSALTVSGTIMGTPLYMSPEQAIGQPVDHRSDIYSLGVMFYQLLTGTPPYTADSPLVILNMHQSAPIPDIHHAAPEIPAHIADMIRKMMAKNPAERYQSCGEIVDELNGFLTTGGATVTVSEEALKDAPDHRKSVLAQAKRGAKPRPSSAPPSGAPQKPGFFSAGRLGRPRYFEKPGFLGMIAGAVAVVAVLCFVGVYLVSKSRSPKPPQPVIASSGEPRSGDRLGAEGAAKQSHAVEASSAESAGKSVWDDVYIATAATGEKIPHPLSRRTYKQALADGTTIDVPEGMVYVPAGEFTMGSNDPNMEKVGFGPAHTVWLDGYFIGKYEVTNAEWKAFADATWYVPPPSHWQDGKIPQGRENHPVVNVSWEDAQKYCEWVCKQTGQDVRLPTEAQWEKAARGPKECTEYPWGSAWDYKVCNNGELVLRNSGFQPKEPGDDFERKWRELQSSPNGKEIISLGGYTISVGSFPTDKSGYGCYDTAGNVRELCSDWYKKFYYTSMPTRNPLGPSEADADMDPGDEGKRRSVRGSDWSGNLYSCRLTNRSAIPLEGRRATYGFRIVVLPRAEGVSAGAAPGSEAEQAITPRVGGAASGAPVKSPWDDVSVATTATGEKIPHPLSRRTYKQTLADGTTIEVPEGMVYVAGGKFIMGDDKDSNARPAHEVDVKPFFMDKYEVTNAQYMVFVTMTGRRAPYYIARNGANIPKGRESHPVSGVTWDDATAYCDWCGKRLPTEAEWEKAASWDYRRNQKYKYPWGNADDSDPNRPLANWAARLGYKAGADYGEWLNGFKAGGKIEAAAEDGGATTPVGSFGAAVSPYQCYDMAGNVAEWVQDWLDRYPGNNAGMADQYEPYRGRKVHVIRGGGWFYHSSKITTTARDFNRNPASADIADGFRCAADYPWRPEQAEGRPPTTPTPPAASAKPAPPSAVPSAEAAKSPWDDAYVATAATGEKIPHPLSRRTYKQALADGTTIDVPEGMVYIPAGEFTMGHGDQPPEGPEHNVWLDGYFIGRYEVTNAEWQAFKDSGTGFTHPGHWKDAKMPEGKENHPVVWVSWDQVQKYCDWVCKMTGREVKLPTEAQWEKAARGPKAYMYPWGNDWISQNCNFQGLCASKYGLKVNPNGAVPDWNAFTRSPRWKEVDAAGGYTTPVGSLEKDRTFYGCYDMAGNAQEWCADWFMTDYYKLTEASRNPQGPREEQGDVLVDKGQNCKARVVRGGCWSGPPFGCRTVHRSRLAPYGRFNLFGFRVVALPPVSTGAAAPPVERPAASPLQPQGKSAWDDAYVATAATGEKIPHPLSRKTRTEILPNGEAVDIPEGMVYAPAGEFMMGVKESKHKVYLDAYFIGKYEVTNAEWKVFTDATGFTPLPQHWKGGEIPQGRENHPVVYVSWEDIQKYCDWASEGTGREVRLPTEAQWVKAAKGPKGFQNPWGNTWDKNLCNNASRLAPFGLQADADTEQIQEWMAKYRAWAESDKGKEIFAAGGNTTPVGSFPDGKCPYGCYDMAGNVYEWCSDWFTTNYYKLKDAGRNPQGPTEEQAEEMNLGGRKMKARVLRGGAWNRNWNWCQLEHRYDSYAPPSRRSATDGFRIAVLPPRKPTEGQKAEPQPSPASVQGAKSPFDDVYVATAATGEKIPHPLSRKTYKQTLADGTTIDVPDGMVYVPAGEFTMGHGDRPPNGPEHKVWLDGYFIGKYEVTNAEWKVFMDSASTPATLILPMCHWKNGAIPQGRENHPVVCLRQDDAKRYCYWLSTATGRDIRLPTEAQWEKAARGPQANDFPWGNVWDDQRCNSGWRLAQQFAFKPKDEGDDWEMKFGEFLWKTPEGDGIRALGGNTMPVGSFPSGRSAYGCYDMAGNTWEWCSDWYRADYYTFKDAMRNPQGPSKEETEPVRWSGPGREITAVLRGGAWSSPSGFCKTWPRKFHAPGNRSLSTGPGFRIVVRLAR